MAKPMNRRELLRTFATGAVVLIGAACAPAAPPASAPRSEPKPAAQPTAAPAAPAAQPTGAAAAAPAAGPTVAAAKPAAQGQRLVVAVGPGNWGTETPFPWMAGAVDQPLWDHMYDRLIERDPATFKAQPGLATEWGHSADYKTWTFKLRQGIKFHGDWGEVTSEDVKFTVEQHLQQGRTGGSAPFFQAQLANIELPDKYTVVVNFKNPLWEVPIHFARRSGYMNIVSKKHLEAVGEDKARQEPIGTGPFRHVEGRQGDFHRFEAVPNHWRQVPGFKELIVRRIADPSTALAGVRSGEVDITQVAGDLLAQAKRAGLRIYEYSGGSQYMIVVPGQTLPDKQDYCPKCAWVGDPADPRSLENAKKVRLALNLAINKKAIVDGLWQGYGNLDPFVPYYYPNHPGFKQDWKVPPYDLARAKQLLAEAGVPNGFEIGISGRANMVDGPDVADAVAQDWEKLGLKVQRGSEDWATFLPKQRARKIGTMCFVYGVPGVTEEPTLSWERVAGSKSTFYIMAEAVEYDQAIDAIRKELDTEKRWKLQTDLGQKFYDDMRYVTLGTKVLTFALSKKVGTWSTLLGNQVENNFEYVTWSGQ